MVSFQASDLPFRVDVVEAEGLASGMAARVTSESVALRDLSLGARFCGRVKPY